MTKEEAMSIMQLLSALEVLGIMKGGIPDYLLEKLDSAVKILEREILK